MVRVGNQGRSRAAARGFGVIASAIFLVSVLTSCNMATMAGTTAPADVDVDFVVRTMVTIVIGLFKRRAHEEKFDGDAELALALAVINAAMRGQIRPVVVGGQ